ncbi:PTS sugar transporter subunit IIA [Heyndrickxia faecalis]|uniref:PTS sugar transporter subunit IIA n=1 Tax=Heyndrickxia faecalis TaxID=2824910 RepID=UPI003D216B22
MKTRQVSVLFPFFHRKRKEEHIFAPMGGEVTPIEEVPDPIFSEKMIGDGVAIRPIEGRVVSPFDGEVIQIFPTKHAIGLRGESGLEVLIHIGLKTVSLDGKGFETVVQAGDKVEKGDPLIRFNLEFIKANAADTITAIIITNGELVKSLEKSTGVEAVAGQTEIMRACL